MEFLAGKLDAGTITDAENAELESYRAVLGLLTELEEKTRQTSEATSDSQAQPAVAAPPPAENSALIVPPGIRRSQEVFWRNLPELLLHKKYHSQWVAYHGDDRIGIARTKTALIREILRRNVPRDDYFVGLIQPKDSPPWVLEEIEPTHFSQHPTPEP